MTKLEWYLEIYYSHLEFIEKNHKQPRYPKTLRDKNIKKLNNIEQIIHKLYERGSQDE